MAEKLYYNDVYLSEFKANILNIIEKEGNFHIVLDRTAFYPESGGQPSDKGTIDDVEVVHVYEENGEVYHVSKRRPEKDVKVSCKIDWNRRFDLMQQHLGQHILSAVLVNSYQANTIGLRFGNDTAQIDLDKFIKSRDLEIVEEIANDVIYKNIKVEILYPDIKEVELYTKRKVPVTDEKIRIVKIEGIDYTPCCGTHTSATGEVGIIKVLKCERVKTGSRIIFACGKRALNFFREKCNKIDNICSELKVGEVNLEEKVPKMRKELENLKQDTKSLMNRLIESDVENYLKSASVICGYNVIASVFSNMKPEYVRELSLKLLENEKTVVLFGIKVGNNAQLLFGSNKKVKEIDVSDIFKQSIGIIKGKGGGSKNYAQGIGPAVEMIEDAIEHACEKTVNVLKKNMHETE